jgi:hypothetical protein
VRRVTRGVRPFHDDRAARDVDDESTSGAHASDAPCAQRDGETAATRMLESRRQLRGDEAVRRNVEEMRGVELVGTSSMLAVPGFPRTFGCVSIAMGSGSA